MEGASETDQLLVNSCLGRTTQIKVYKRRWWTLFVFCTLALLQSELLQSWTVITESVKTVFCWTDEQITLMLTWTYSTYLVAIFLIVWLMDVKGLRVSVILGACLVTLGTVLRCVADTPPAVLWYAHASQICIGLAGPSLFAAGPVLSMLWFPPSQRTTATAIAMISGYLGTAVCFLIGPNFVDSPVFVLNTSSGDCLSGHYPTKCAITVVVLIALLVYFPSRPFYPPSYTAGLTKTNFCAGLRDLFRWHNANFWLMCVSLSLVVSVYGVWNGIFDINLQYTGLKNSEEIAGWLGFCAVGAGCVAAVIIGRLADLLVGRMKMILIVMTAACIICTLVVLLYFEGYISMSLTGLFVACTLQGLFNNGAIPLYYELAIEAMYPISESVVAGMMTIAYNVLPTLFLLIFSIPNVGTRWTTWCVYISMISAFPLLIRFKQQYKRLAADKSRSMHSNDANEQINAS